MSILGRYLVRTYFGMVSTCLGAFVAIYLVVDFLERYGKLSRTGGTLPQILGYFLCKIPEMISQTAPMAVLMGTILAMGALSRSSEITAMRSSGISLLQIGRPLILTAGMISLALLLMQETVAPLAREKMIYIEQVLIKKKGKGALFRQNNIWHRDGGLIMQAKMFDPDRLTLSGVTVWEVDNSLKPLARVDAQKATAVDSGWKLENPVKRRFDNIAVTEENRSAIININLSVTDLKDVARTAEEMGFIALSGYIKSVSESGYDATRLRTLLYSKLSLPFTALIMAFLGIPFSLREGRSGGIGVGIGFSVIIGFSFFIFNSFLISLGQAGALNPMVAAWSANLVFAAAGLWFTLTVDS